jgi:hypothetical protein
MMITTLDRLHILVKFLVMFPSFNEGEALNLVKRVLNAFKNYILNAF